MSSSSKGGKRISVFDRLGPGNDESPSSHRRYSSDKHPSSTEKPSRHGYLGRTDEAARKTDYDEKKLHYVAPPPSSRIPPPPLPSRHRHFHGSPEPEFPGEEELARPSPVERRVPTRTSKPRGEPSGDVDGHKHHPPTLDERPRGKGVHGGRGSSSPSDGSGAEDGKRKGRGHQQDRRLKYGPELSSASEESLRRASKHGVERKEKSSSDRHSDRLQSAVLSVSSSEGVKGRTRGSGRDERVEVPPHHGRRRKEEEPGGIEAPPSRDRKRKREQDDDEYLLDFEAKRSRSGQGVEYGSKEPERPQRPPREQGGGDDDKQHASSSSRGEALERKRRHDSSKEGPPRKRARDQSPLSTKKQQHSGQTSTKRTDHHGRGKTEVEATPISEEGESNNGEEASGLSASAKKLDWSTLSSLSVPRPEWKPTKARERFTPGAIFAEVGVSPTLAGSYYYSKITKLVSGYLKRSQSVVDPLRSNQLPESVVDDPFEGAGFASAGVARIKEQADWMNLFSDIGPCRRALTASADYNLRRKLRKKSDRQYLASPQPVSNWPESEHYATAVALYNSLGKRASGKPAFRVQPSKVGTLLVAR